MFITIDNNDPRPVYLQIAAAIKEQNQQGMMQPGSDDSHEKRKGLPYQFQYAGKTRCSNGGSAHCR
jgi:hypothetical protein